MNQIGYSIIDESGVEVRFWGSQIDRCASIPDRIDLPNGDFVHGAIEGYIGQFRLVKRMGIYSSSPSPGFDGQQVVIAFPVTPEMVVAERERRLASGFSYTFDDPRGTHQIGTTAQDMTGWNAVTMLAQAAINLGAPTTSINIVTNTGPVSVTALEWQTVLLAASAFQQPIWAASFALQAASPIPSNYQDDSHWG